MMFWGTELLFTPSNILYSPVTIVMLGDITVVGDVGGGVRLGVITAEETVEPLTMITKDDHTKGHVMLVEEMGEDSEY